MPKAPRVFNQDHFVLDSGREVSLRILHVELSALEFLEGTFDLVRQEVLQNIPQRAKEVCPGRAGIHVFEPPEDELPTYVFFAALQSDNAIRDGDVSSLVVCWFAEKLPMDLFACVVERARSVDWAKHAVDGFI